MKSLARNLALGAAALVLTASPGWPALLKPMNLDDLTTKADRIFSGRVIAVEKGRVAAGGATLPTVTYRVEVDRVLAGLPAEAGRQVTEIRMIGDVEEMRRDDRVRFRLLPPRPRIESGQRYLFFVTAPGAAGLSTTVGLGQGCFRLTGDPGDEDAVNQYDNIGLFRRMNMPEVAARGPVKYSTLVPRIESVRRRR